MQNQPLEDLDYMEVVVFRSFSLKTVTLRLFSKKYNFYFSLEFFGNIKNTLIVKSVMDDSMPSVVRDQNLYSTKEIIEQ